MDAKSMTYTPEPKAEQVDSWIEWDGKGNVLVTAKPPGEPGARKKDADDDGTIRIAIGGGE